MNIKSNINKLVKYTVKCHSLSFISIEQKNKNYAINKKMK